jgi:polysaccharide export outer membrane protein
MSKQVLLILALLATARFALAQTPAAAPMPGPTPTAAATPSAPSSSNGSQYIIGPGDAINIFVWRNPELSVTVPVRPDGKISTPLVEDMVAVGKSPTQLARDIEKVLAEYVRSPQVNVIVSNAISTFSQIKVIGQVRSPQAVAYREGLRVIDVVLAVGGLTEFASANRAKIVRQVNGRNTEIVVKLGNLMNKGDMRQNHELRPGDVLVVPQSVL